MEEKDLKQIREVFAEEFQKGFETNFPKAFDDSFGKVWEHNLEPAFNSVYEQIGVVEAKLDRALYSELIHLESRVSRLEEKAGIKKIK